MQVKTLSSGGSGMRFAVILEAGDEVMSSLQTFVDEQELSAAQFSAIGAFQRAELNYFDWDAKQYLKIPVEEQTEVASLIGDVALAPDGKRAVHIHTVLGKRDGSALAGHLSKGVVRPTLEIIVSESPPDLRKRHDPDSGLALIRMD